MAGDPSPTDRLKAAGQAGYDKFPHDCSHSVWEMLHQMGMDEPYRTANVLMGYLSSASSGWRKVDVIEAGRLANEGKVVIGGLASQSGSGHVVMVMPGASKPAGGFRMNSGKMLPQSGSFPLSASGAASSWPGAHSRGEKTVRDPWTPSDWPYVTFWTKN